MRTPTDLDAAIGTVLALPVVTVAVAHVERAFGKPHAVKRGRNPKWPYVPVVKHEPTPGYWTQTTQIQAKAYATRDEAVAYADKHIAANRIRYLTLLATPRHRAARTQIGLPSELTPRETGAITWAASLAWVASDLPAPVRP